MLGIPAVTFYTPPFRTLALRRRESLGTPDLALVMLVHPMMTRTATEIETLADQVLPEVVKALLASTATAEAR